MNSGNIHVLPLGSIHVLLHELIMPCWNFEYTKAVTLHSAEVGGSMGQGPATQVTRLRLNQPSSFGLVYLNRYSIITAVSTCFEAIVCYKLELL